MDELVQWLGEQLDEDERITREADPGPWGVGSTTEPDWGPAPEGEPGDVVFIDGEAWPKSATVRGTHVYTPGRMIADMSRGYPLSRHESNADHIAAHDPARVLREIDAKRRILRALESAEVSLRNTEPGNELRELMTGSVNSLRAAVRMLASVYADRPGYREEWRP